jgi:hypothetical protein
MAAAQKKIKRRARPKFPISIRAVDFVMYCAKDSLKLRSWYQNVFGLKRGKEWHEFWSEFATEPLTLCINGPNRSKKAEWSGVAARRSPWPWTTFIRRRWRAGGAKSTS